MLVTDDDAYQFALMTKFLHREGFKVHTDGGGDTGLAPSCSTMKPVRWDRFKNVMDRPPAAEGDALVIDDDPDRRARLRKALERDGWAVREAENGRQGFDRLDAAWPGVVLLDLTMPVMNGFALLEAMRTRPGCAAILVVVLTALDLTWEDRRRLRGARQTLHKGDVSMRDLAERLHGLTGMAEGADDGSGARSRQDVPS